MGIGAPVSDGWPAFGQSRGFGNAHLPLAIRAITIKIEPRNGAPVAVERPAGKPEEYSPR
jgi:hypothetical protein